MITSQHRFITRCALLATLAASAAAPATAAGGSVPEPSAATRLSDARTATFTLPVPLADVSPPLRVLVQQVAPTPHAQRIIPYRRVTPQMRTPVSAAVLANRAANPYSGLVAWPSQPPMPSVFTNGTPINMEGIPQNSGAPSDANGAVGANQYIQWVNTQFSIFNKTDGALQLGPLDGNVLWSGLSGSVGAETCRDANQGDPIVQYDQLAHRWILSQLAFINPNTGPFFECIAVSTSEDATGGYYRYILNNINAAGASLLGDYPKMGVWPDAYYFSFVMFTNGVGDYLGPRVCGLGRAAMLVGGAASAACYDFGTAFGPILPADIDGTAAPAAADAPTYLASVDFDAAGHGEHLFFWRFSFTGRYVTTPITLPVAPFTIACPSVSGGPCIQQPPPGEVLDALGDRLMYRMGYRNFGTREVLVVNHSVQQPGAPTDGPVGVRWYEIRNPAADVFVYQQGTWAPDGDSRWMGSMGLDKMGNIALGYSVTGPSTPPGIRYTGRLRTEPLGRMETEAVVINGTGVQTETFHRWGDYSGMEMDAADDCTFWYTNQYIATTGKFTWQSRIANFKFRNCQ